MMLESTENKPDRISALGFGLVALLTAGAWIGPVLWLESRNPRLLPSWAGFLHAAIATRFASSGAVPPDNPFFAGEGIRYYWLYHYLVYQFSRLVHTDLLHAFNVVTVGSLGLLVIFAALIGRARFRSITAGLLIGYYALAGLNPFGPALAVAHHLVRHRPLLHTFSPQDQVESVFVDSKVAGTWERHPYLSAMYAGEPMLGNTLLNFLTISSRPVALALVLILLFLLLRNRPTRATVVAATLVTALMTALNPLIGLSAAGSLAAASLVVGRWMGRDGTRFDCPPKTYARYTFFTCVAGVLLALPAYYHLFLTGQRTVGFSSPGQILLKSAVLSANFVLLLPLALLGVWTASRQHATQLRTITVAGALLLFVVPFVKLYPGGNEHNFIDSAQCLLAVPAGALITHVIGRKNKWWMRRRAGLFPFLLLLPTTVLTLLAFTGRPGIALGFHDQLLHREPETQPLEQLYVWVRNQTPADAVFIADPDERVKMAGRVAEFPAFTWRALFVDRINYMTHFYKDEKLRLRIASRAADGQPLSRDELSYIQKLRRPVYVVIYRAEREALLRRLILQYGEPVFQRDFVAVFQVGGRKEAGSSKGLPGAGSPSGEVGEQGREVARERPAGFRRRPGRARSSEDHAAWPRSDRRACVHGGPRATRG